MDKYVNFDKQPPELQDEIVENIDNVLQAHGLFQLIYSSPVEQLPWDVWIYGTRGVYVVSDQDGSELFTRKTAAVRYANKISKVSWEIADNEGLIP